MDRTIGGILAEASGWGERSRQWLLAHSTARGGWWGGTVSLETCNHSYPPSDHPVKVPDQGMLGGFAVGMRKEGFPDQSMDGWGQERLPQGSQSKDR